MARARARARVRARARARARAYPNHDLLSDVERDELTFEFLGEAAGCEAFFGTAEYALHPSPSLQPLTLTPTRTPTLTLTRSRASALAR